MSLGFYVRVFKSFRRLLCAETRLDFSSISLGLYLICLMNNFNLGMWTIYACFVSNLITFHACNLFFPGSHIRMARKLQLQWDEFKFLDAVYHLLPLIIFFPTKKEKTYFYSAVIHLLWGAIVSKGTFNLDDVYVPIPSWKILWVTSFLVDVLIGMMAW